MHAKFLLPFLMAAAMAIPTPEVPGNGLEPTRTYQLEARRDPGRDAVPKKPKKPVPTSVRTRFPPAGLGRPRPNGKRDITDEDADEMHPLEARRDPGRDAVPKKPKKPVPTSVRTRFPPAGLGRPRPNGKRDIMDENADETHQLEARRDPGRDAVPKKPKKPVPTSVRTRFPPAGLGRPRPNGKRDFSPLDARRDPGRDAVPKKPKKPVPTSVRTRFPPAGLGRPRPNGKRDVNPLEARRDPGRDAVPKKPKKPVPTSVRTRFPPAGLGRPRPNGRRDVNPLEARRDPGRDALPKKPKKPVPTSVRTRFPPAGLGRPRPNGKRDVEEQADEDVN